MRRFFLCCLLFALPAAAQLDSPALRTKYGLPLNRETFQVHAIELTVDYGAGNQVCKLAVHALPNLEPGSGPFNPKKEMQDFLLDLVPASMRGKELNRGMSSFGLMSMSWIEYEHVMISEPNQPVGNETITLTFTDADCR